MHGEIYIAVRPYAAELGCDVVDDGQAAVVEFGLPQVPGLLVPHHRVELVHCCDEGKLRVLEYLSVTPRQLLVFGLLSSPGGAH